MLIRSATETDIQAICDLINGFAEQNLMLYRSPAQVRMVLDDFLVAEDDHGIAGCGYLAHLGEDLVEIRSLAVHPRVQGQGVGAFLVERLLRMAMARGVRQVCALTLVPEFFARLGFERVDRWAISPKIWGECVYCPKFHACDEIAVLRIVG